MRDQQIHTHLIVSPTGVTSNHALPPVGDWLDPGEVTALDLYEAHPLLSVPASGPAHGRYSATPSGESAGILPNVQYLRIMGIGSFATEDLLDDIMLRSRVRMNDAVAIFAVPFRTSWASSNGDTQGFRRYYTGSRSHRFRKVVYVANHKPNLGGSVFEFKADDVDFVLIPPMGFFQQTNDEGEARLLKRTALFWQETIDRLRRFHPRTRFTMIGTEAWGDGWSERASRLRSGNFEVITRNEYRRRIPREEFELITTVLADLRAVYPEMWPDPLASDTLSDNTP